MTSEKEILKQVEGARLDMEAADSLIGQYMPFILSEASRYAGRPLKKGIDDEVSIAMIAFHEAIRSYTRSRGAFIAYAGLLIRSRLIDFTRKEVRHQQIVSLDEPAEESGKKTRMDLLEDKANTTQSAQNRKATREEITELNQKMKEYGLSLKDVALHCPKQERTLQACGKLVAVLKEHPELLDQFLKTKKLPVRELVRYSKIEKKTIERHRKYIMALFLIYSNGFEMIRGHLKQVLNGGAGR